MEDFHHDRLQFPQIPELMHSVLSQIDAHTNWQAEDDREQSAFLVRLISGQLALAIALTRAAGTPSIPAAVVRLGPQRVRNLVVNEANRPAQPSPSPLVRERLIRAHRHSVEVAAFSQVIAAHDGRLDPDKALLCGLLHDVGTFAVLSRAADMMDRFGTDLALDAATRRLHGIIGRLMLGRWGYDRDVVMCAEGADDWRRDPGPTIDYADIVLVARLHSFIGSSRAHWLPQFDTVPAFGKLTGGAPSPAITRTLLNQGRRRALELASPLTAAPLSA